VDALLAQRLGFASPNQIKELQQRVGVILLIDDVDKWDCFEKTDNEIGSLG
jgi:hypothetical protein